MKPNDLAICLRDLSDTLNVCGNDYSDILYTAAAQLEQRLLTDAEREAINRLTRHHEFHPDDPDQRGRFTWISSEDAATLRGLLERTK